MRAPGRAAAGSQTHPCCARLDLCTGRSSEPVSPPDSSGPKFKGTVMRPSPSPSPRSLLETSPAGFAFFFFFFFVPTAEV